MKNLLRRLRNSKRGFSLVELIVVIAIMAVIAAVLVPSLLMHVEESRAEKDVKTTDEVVTAVELALADQDVYDELVEHSVFDNVSCYVDKDSEAGYERVVIKETYNGYAEQYMFDDDARQNDEVPYYGAGNMRGLTITFSPEKDSNESTYDLARAIINRFVGRKTGYLYENEKLYNAIRSVVGDKIYNSSQTYRNSDFTIFIRLGSTGGNEAGNQDATQVWGQYNGTNLPADTVQTAKITTDRAVGDAGQYDQAVNDYINDEANTNIDFSKLAAMGNSNFGSTLEKKEETSAAGLYNDKGTVIYSWEELINSEKLPIQMIDIMGNPSGTTSALKFNNGTISTVIDVMTGSPHSASVLNGHLVLDSSVKTIGSQCFMSCTNLKSITIPKNVTSINGAAFAYCSNLMDINYEGTRQEWSNINLELSHPAWNINCPAIVHCSDGDVGCLTCGGTGTIDKETTCTKCDGGCTVLCPSCAGLPGTPCSHRCFHCDGGSNLQEWTVCTACNGTGQMDGFPQCPACNGAKMIRWCTTCNSSSGYFNAKNCMICNGSGFVDGTGCGTCHGAGFVGCDKCNSTGKIQSSSDCPDCE